MIDGWEAGGRGRIGRDGLDGRGWGECRGVVARPWTWRAIEQVWKEGNFMVTVWVLEVECWKGSG